MLWVYRPQAELNLTLYSSQSLRHSLSQRQVPHFQTSLRAQTPTALRTGLQGPGRLQGQTRIRRRTNRQDRQGYQRHAGEDLGDQVGIAPTGKSWASRIDLLDFRGEGLVVKNIDSVYQTNARGADWVKVKPEYSDQMGENLDLLVLGGWWGKGGRTGKISSLLCGLRVPQEDDCSGETPE